MHICIHTYICNAYIYIYTYVYICIYIYIYIYDSYVFTALFSAGLFVSPNVRKYLTGAWKSRRRLDI